jgi:hypothetical protein
MTSCVRAQIRALTAKDGPARILRREEWESILALISSRVVIGQSVSAGVWEPFAKGRRNGSSVREITLMTVVAASLAGSAVKLC